MTEPRYPGGRPGVFRVSQSSLETYLRCGIRYFLDRETKHRRSTVPLLRGIAVSEAACVDNTRKIDTGRGATLRALTDAAVASYDEGAGSAELPESRSEIVRGRDSTAECARAYGVQLSPKITGVLLAEEPIHAAIDEWIELVGTPDVITEGGVVRDTKTGKPWTQHRVDRSRQLSGYDLLHEARFSRPTDRVAIDSFAETRNGWQLTTYWSSRSEADRVAFVEAARRAKAGIEAGVALPAAEADWSCDRRYCEHWNHCPAVAGRRERE